jgi:hypothetical protein
LVLVKESELMSESATALAWESEWERESASVWASGTVSEWASG